MTTLLLPLVAGFAAVGMPAGGLRPAEPAVAPPVQPVPWPTPVAAADGPASVLLGNHTAARPAAGEGAGPQRYPSLLTVPAYPEGFELEPGTPATVAGDPLAGRYDGMGRVPGDGGDADVLQLPPQPADDEFELTGGAGMVGIGFRWRFR